MTSTHDDNRTHRADEHRAGTYGGNGDPARRGQHHEYTRRQDDYGRRRDEHRYSDFRDDMNKDPHELEREADRARASIEHTLEALERRLSPGELLDQVLHVAKDNGGEFGRNLATQVRNNPLPVLLTGIGMTWLLTASNRPPRSYARPRGYGAGYGYEGAAGSAGEGMRDRASGMASSARDTAASARERASAMGSSMSSGASSAADAARNAVSRAGESVRSTADHAMHAAHDVADSARHARDSAMGAMHGLADSTRAGAESLWGGYDYLKREQPLVLGALAVAAGALVGAMLPATRAENRMMGRYSEEVTERLKDEARQRADDARGAAADAAEAAREAVQPKRAGRADSPESGEAGSATSA